MKQPYLVQRLLRPIDTSKDKIGLLNAFAFGGGLKNGGLSDEAMKILNKIWRYDYMGSAEFEWGAVPKSLAAIAKDASLYVRGKIPVTAEYHYWKENRKLSSSATIFYACKAADEPIVRDWINGLASKKYYLKEGSYLPESICGETFYTDTVGWHDIDNHYLFFKDKDMFDAFCKAFGIPETKA